jgi:protein-tyrosine phosphatase
MVQYRDRQVLEHIQVEADLHCHLLPAWDDGPQTLDESIHMAHKAANQGIKTIVLTPHVGRAFHGKPEREGSEIAGAAANLQQAINTAGIDLTVVPGAEVALSLIDLAKRVENEPWLTVGGQGRYILVESTVGYWPESASQTLFDLALRGLTPIIAHPERLRDVQADLSIIEEVVARGALLQITARSVGGSSTNSQCCRKLLQAGLVSLVASDAHSPRHSFRTDEMKTAIYETVGEKAARRILVDNPRAVLTGQPVAKPAFPSPQKNGAKRSKFGLINKLLARQ